MKESNYNLKTSLERNDCQWTITALQCVSNVMEKVRNHGYKDKLWFDDFKKELRELIEQ